MAKIISTVDDAVTFLNALYEADSTAPTSGDEDYTVWTSLFNIAVNIWESEEGVLWRELFVSLVDASDGDKTTTAGVTSYDVPTDFVFPASGYVWLGSGTNKIPYKVIPIENVQLTENDISHWCYFTGSKLEFNPNLASNIFADYTISYDYYKYATKLTTGSSVFEMSDPMFAVYYALSELKKEEGDTSASLVASQKLEGMKTKNMMATWHQNDTILDPSDVGFGI